MAHFCFIIWYMHEHSHFTINIWKPSYMNAYRKMISSRMVNTFVNAWPNFENQKSCYIKNIDLKCLCYVDRLKSHPHPPKWNQITLICVVNFTPINLYWYGLNAFLTSLCNEKWKILIALAMDRRNSWTFNYEQGTNNFD